MIKMMMTKMKMITINKIFKRMMKVTMKDRNNKMIIKNNKI